MVSILGIHLKKEKKFKLHVSDSPKQRLSILNLVARVACLLDADSSQCKHMRKQVGEDTESVREKTLSQ